MKQPKFKQKVQPRINMWSIQTTKEYSLQTSNKAALCGDDRTLQYTYDHISFVWLSIKDFINNVVSVLSTSIFYNNKSIVNEFLKKGLIAYKEQLDFKDDSVCSHDAVACFLLATIKTAKTTCNFTLTDNNTGETWDILNNIPLSIWRLNRQNLSITQNNLTGDEISRAIYFKTIPANIKRSMRRHKHEHAILASHMDTHH